MGAAMGLFSIIGSIMSAVLPMMMGGGQQAMPMPMPPPPPTPEPTKEPEGAKDSEIARRRALNRKRISESETLLGLDKPQPGNLTKKTILGG